MYDTMGWSNQCLRNRKMKASAESLGHRCSQDTSLNLMRMGIDDAGAVALARALHHNSTQEWLDFLSNVTLLRMRRGLITLVMLESSPSSCSPPSQIYPVGAELIRLWLWIRPSLHVVYMTLPSRCEHNVHSIIQWRTELNFGSQLPYSLWT